MEFEEYLKKQKQLNEIRRLLKKIGTIKDCSHPTKEDCRLPIKNAHSLQRQGSLKYLEKNKNGNAFVYCHKDREYNREHNFLDLKPIGRKDASTFFGFCEFHDTEVFKIIENNPEATDINNDEHCFLHTYRSFSHSYHIKYEEMKIFTSEDLEIKSALSKAFGEDIVPMLSGIQMALSDFEIPKKRLDKLLVDKKFSELNYLCFQIPYRCPVACSGVSTPGHFINNDPFNLSTDLSYTYSDIFTTVLPLKDRTVIILASFLDDEKANRYLDEFENIKYELEFQKYLSFHIINNVQNTFISPLFYDKKNLLWKKNYCKLLDFIASSSTPFISFNKHFPINYFSPTEKI